MVEKPSSESSGPEEVRSFVFRRGSSPERTLIESDEEWDKAITSIRKDVSDALNSKNVAFLLGSGCSSLSVNDVEVGIPTMGPMAALFHSLNAPDGVSRAERGALKNDIGLNLEEDQYKSNLETVMEILYGSRFVLARSSREEDKTTLESVNSVIAKISNFVKKCCTVGKFSNGDESVVALYTQFYMRLIQRDRTLPRPWVFTTNYDLFNETSLDRAGIPYINGFLGSIERRFNPAIFRYQIAEPLDLASKKLIAIDSLIYFVKLHGSVSWETRDVGLYPVVETHPALIEEQTLIYPTPAKGNASFASPYSDMFREFQTRVTRQQSVLFVLGYGFGDEHVNNIIFQALTIPTFRLIIFSNPDNQVVSKLLDLSDPRIWVIGSTGATWKAHYFESFVHEFMAYEGDDPAQVAIDRVIEQLLNPDS